MEIQTVKADNEDLPHNPPPMLKNPDYHEITEEQLVAEVKGIYAGLTMIERKCIEVDNAQDARAPLDVPRFLEKIPPDELILLQCGGMQPHDTVFNWFIKVQMDARRVDEPSTPESSENLPTAREAASTRPHVPVKAALRVPSPEECLHGFSMALELRAKAEEWPKHEEFAVLTTANSGEDDCKKTIDGNYLLTIGARLVDNLLRDLETAKANAKQEATQANEDEDPDSAAVPTHVGDTVGTAVGTLIHTEMTGTKTQAKSETEKKPQTEQSRVDNRPLHDKSLYKKVGNEHYMRVDDIWIPSLTGKQYRALIELHSLLMDEHYDFFICSQHYKASPALRNLAKKYAMSARLWKHGMHAFLELLRHRLPESLDFTEDFVSLTYKLLSALDEDVPRFRCTWAEMKGDVARYGWGIQGDTNTGKRWNYVSLEDYTRVRDVDPTVGRLYHHLAILKRPKSPSQPDAYFDATVFQLFYFTKSLVVKVPFFAALGSLFTVIDPIIGRTKEEPGELVSGPTNNSNHFLAAVASLILASMEAELLQAHGYNAGKEGYLQAMYAELEKIGRPARAQAQISRIRPSAQLGLLLCQLLLGIPPAAGRWSPMMATWAPDLVTPADHADLAASMANARSIHDATITMVHTMVPYLLEEADTRDLGVWGFIYVILVFMRSLKTRPNLLKWFGYAFHAEIIAYFLNMLLREDETRGGRALARRFESELPTLCSPLNQKEKPGKYGSSTIDDIKRYHFAQEEHQMAEGSGSMATKEEATTSDATHKRDRDPKTPDAERMYTNPLPEDELLEGHFFAREADAPCEDSLVGSTEDAVVCACPPAPKVTIAAMEQTQKESLTDETESSAPRDKQKDREVEEEGEAEGQRQEGLLLDPPLFPAGWFKNSKYDFDERQVRQEYVQDAETYNNRSSQLLCLAVQLIGTFFIFQTDENGRYWISMPGIPSLKPDLDNMKMPEVVERDGGVRVVYVDPSFRIAEIEKEECERKNEKERATGEKAKGDAIEVPTAAAGIVPENEAAVQRAGWPLTKLYSEDEDSWTHISDESREDAQTVQRSAQVPARSVISRWFSTLRS
ncbi:hypothetical protein VM1G_00671 [Cytospora mali]|uniref:Uncharacterized protein n=1 Tax=Cytospora mali TaxID=578113 RepID=A0A194VKX0_CYTMA|nr:hypothetical protein VM1G_00671 [Valsa mali]